MYSVSSSILGGPQNTQQVHLEGRPQPRKIRVLGHWEDLGWGKGVECGRSTTMKTQGSWAPAV